jgi:hypothetical protein
MPPPPPVKGMHGRGATDIVMNAEIPPTRVKGLFAGVSPRIDSAPDGGANENLYGRKLSQADIREERSAFRPARMNWFPRLDAKSLRNKSEPKSLQ